MPQPIVIRLALEQDVPALLSIYAPYVNKTAVTFEYTVPSAEQFAARMRRVQAVILTWRPSKTAWQ